MDTTTGLTSLFEVSCIWRPPDNRKPGKLANTLRIARRAALLLGSIQMRESTVHGVDMDVIPLAAP